ncbi:TetR family transcriptional regulator C-terminal domain-containing protein [Pleomorphomonas sp. PLEO]|uniref:TetR family transcriptional regulator C-terminal domain-containing protein n=1 Tax=Pleomorphomonas sp. PLEO TaxID=3239306 RepID=UPI00351F16A1
MDAEVDGEDHKARPRRRVAVEEGARDDRVRQRNVARILKAATTLFSRKGFEGTRIVEIAEAAGLPKANVYYYFSSKEEVYDAVIKHLIDEWDAALAHISADAEPREALESYVRAKLEHARRHGEESRLFAGEIIGGARFLSRRDRSHMREVTRDHARVIESWIAAGKIKPVDPRHLLIMLWAVTQFYADFEILACDALEQSRLRRADFDKAAETIVSTLLGSLMPD